MDKQAFVAELRRREGENTPAEIGHVAGVAYFARGISEGDVTLHIASDRPDDTAYYVKSITRADMDRAGRRRREITVGEFCVNTNLTMNDVRINGKPRKMVKI